MSSQKFTARVNEEDDGTYWAEIVELPGCFATGDSLEELRSGLSEAIALCRADAVGDLAASDLPDDLSSESKLTVCEMRLLVHRQ